MHMRILGVDPGIATVGFAVLDAEKRSQRLLTCGVITTPAKTQLSSRLDQIYRDLNELIAQFHPEVMAVEELFFNTNITTGIAVAHGRGIILLSGYQAGLQIYEYTPGFIHAKMFTSDDEKAVVGTINLDFRSLYLHFENGVFIYDNPEVQKVEEDFQNTLAKCHKVTVTEVRNRGILMKTAGQVLRLVAPLM